MKKFIKNIFLLLLFPLLLFSALELAIALTKEKIFNDSYLEKKFDNTIRQYAWLNNLKTDSLNILAGSSTSLYDLSCKELMRLNPDGSTYINLGGHARGPLETYYLLRTLDLSKIKNIYFSMDLLNYDNKLLRFKNPVFYLDLGIKDVLKFSVLNKENSFLTRYNMFFDYLFDLSDEKIEKNKNTPKDYGSKIFNIQLNTRHYYEHNDIFTWSILQFEYLKKIEELCKKNKINFYIYVAPWRKDFSEYYKRNYKKKHAAFKKLLSDHNISAYIFGKTDILDKNQDTLFYDELHLNAEGQNVFSKIFYDLSTQKKTTYHENYSWFLNENN